MKPARIELRIEPELKALWEEKAKKAGLSLSNWIMQRCQGVEDPKPQVVPYQSTQRYDRWTCECGETMIGNPICIRCKEPRPA